MRRLHTSSVVLNRKMRLLKNEFKNFRCWQKVLSERGFLQNEEVFLGQRDNELQTDKITNV